MKRLFAGMLLLLLISSPSLARQTVPVIPFDSVSTGPAYAATTAQLLEFGPDGQYLREIGHNLYAWVSSR